MADKAPPAFRRVLERLQGVQGQAEGWRAICPAHIDRKPSLSISAGNNGTILLKCHAGCSTKAVAAAIGLELKDLFSVPEHNGRSKLGTLERTYDYHDADGTLLYQTVRFRNPKDFRQRRPDGKGGWYWNLTGVRRVLYRLPQLRAASPSEWVFVVEGEKDAEALAGLGLVATTNVGGAGKWKAEYSEVLRGRQVVILPDNDDTGRNHAKTVATSLCRVASWVRVVELPDLPQKGDVSDWLRRPGNDVAALLGLIDAAPFWEAPIEGGERHSQNQEPDAKQTGTSPTHTWVTTTLEGDLEDEPKPELILGLFYPDKRHLLYGETECQKTWLALCAVADVVKGGKRVLWIDHEMTAREMRLRLDKLGCTAEERGRVHYCHPSEALAEPSRAYLSAVLDEVDPALIVVDAFSGALGVAMLDDNSNVQVEKWWQDVGLLLWGPEKRALVIVDHVNKSEENRNRYPSGSKRKLEGADVGLAVDAVKRLSRDPPTNGLCKLMTTKDRPGWLGRRPGDLELNIDADGRIAWRLRPAEQTGPDQPFRPTLLMERVSLAVEGASQGVSKRTAEDLVRGRREYVRKAVDLLIAEGYLEVEEGPRRAEILTSAKPYRADETASAPQCAPVRPECAPGALDQP